MPPLGFQKGALNPILFSFIVVIVTANLHGFKNVPFGEHLPMACLRVSNVICSAVDLCKDTVDGHNRADIAVVITHTHD